MFKIFKFFDRMTYLEERVEVLEKKVEEMMEVLEENEENVEEIGIKTVSKMTTKADEPITSSQIINEWMNGDENE